MEYYVCSVSGYTNLEEMESFERTVKGLLADGWACQGGVCVATYEEIPRGQKDKQTMFLASQAMVKPRVPLPAGGVGGRRTRKSRK
jgi:hypothetical protein